MASSIGGAAYNVKPMKDHEWNLSVQKTLPFKTAVTVSYVGSKADGLVVDNSLNNVAPGLYTNLQAAKPYPVFGSIDLYKNTGSNHYNSGQLKVERRFDKGLSFMFSYAYSKNISDGGGDSIWSTPVPFAPAGYNRGRASYDHTHIAATNVVWEVPFGRGRRLGGNMNPVANTLIGGWEFSGIYLYNSGDPLTFGSPGATLGNGWGTRPNLVGDPSVSNPNSELVVQSECLLYSGTVFVWQFGHRDTGWTQLACGQPRSDEEVRLHGEPVSSVPLGGLQRAQSREPG